MTLVAKIPDAYYDYSCSQHMALRRLYRRTQCGGTNYEDLRSGIVKENVLPTPGVLST
jgi:hypothetical protein